MLLLADDGESSPGLRDVHVRSPCHRQQAHAPPPRRIEPSAHRYAPSPLLFFIVFHCVYFILLGWAANCVNFTSTPPLGLSVSTPNLIGVWDGPFDSVFPDAVGWVIAVTGGFLGSSLIYMLCQM